MKKKSLGFSVMDAMIAIQVGNKIIEAICEILDITMDDWDGYHDQIEMDKKGLGFNAKN